ncbi:GNAT family N-acetyltransferase [uncultured Limosilactobacillus sp.]|uniref:GNAT family N-acetyltransferase n=1 Tax=uncultured Limosilactobacillus sp. TaxID=2837629 RepID=UPI0025F04C83|nr:GNAT family N-acetyltransferase [uncultured Limosilactobacillus sp.]
MKVSYLRPAQVNDIDAIMPIIESARALLKAEGSTQWQSGDPDRRLIGQDIEQHVGEVLIVDQQVAGYAALVRSAEPTYAKIYSGHWASNDPYTTIHRVAIAQEFRGQHLATQLFAELITSSLQLGFSNIRFDTFRLNERLQYLAKKFGFVQRGQIKVSDPLDPWRLAYELNL